MYIYTLQGKNQLNEKRNGLVECNHVNPRAWGGIPSVGCFGLIAIVMANFGNVVQQFFIFRFYI